MTNCPNCGSLNFYNRNAIGKALWYCENCEEQFTENDIEAFQIEDIEKQGFDPYFWDIPDRNR